MNADIVVLGAGPAGVGAAYRAAHRGRKVIVIERASHPGGAAGSFTVGGIRVDHGSHRLHPSVAPEILADLRSELGDDLQRRVRSGRIRLANRWIRFPPSPVDLVAHLPPRFAAGVAADAATSWARRARSDTFAEVLLAGLGPTMCDRFYFPYAHKLWGMEPEEISGEQARRRVSAGSAGALLRRAIGRRPRGASFYYPRRGFGQIVEALERSAASAGADFRYGSAARRVELDDHEVRVETEGGDVVSASLLFSTVPVTALARLTSPGPPPAVRAAAEQLAYRSMLLVYLVLDVDRYTVFDAHYLPEAWTPVTRISEPKNYRSGADPAGRTVLCAEIPCSRPLLDASEDALASLVLETLERSGLPPARPVECTVRRLAHAYPVYGVGFERHHGLLDDWATSLGRVVTFGRQGLFVHDNSHHAYAMAWAAAGAVGDDGSFDRRAWSAARARFETHVVED